MLSALGEPPDSGRKMPAKAEGASARDAITAMGSDAARALRRGRELASRGATGGQVYGRPGEKAVSWARPGPQADRTRRGARSGPAHAPVKEGGRFCTKASTPSRKSADAADSCCSR